MGSKGSKPVVETARQTLARRGQFASPVPLSNAPAVINPTTNAVARSDIGPPIAREVQVKSEENVHIELDQSVVKEISKWSVVDSKTSKGIINDDGSAVMIRLNEEKKLKDNKGNLPKQFLGKLTEEQLISVLSQSRDNTHTGDDLAVKYGIKIESYNQLIAATTIPRITNEQDEGAHEFLVAK